MKTKQAPKQIPQQQIVHNHFGNRAHAAHKLRWYIAAPRLLPVPPLPYSGYPNRLSTESAPPRSPSTSAFSAPQPTRLVVLVLSFLSPAVPALKRNPTN